MRPWWAAQGGRMLPFWLPAYAPNLSLLERVWRFLKQKLACHCLWTDRDRLQHATCPLPDQTQARFHSTDRPTIRLGHTVCQSAQSGCHIEWPGDS